MVFDEDDMPDAIGSLEHPNEDLDHVLMHRGSIRSRDQIQVQSLLRHERFLEWLNDENPDLILVNSNIRSTGMENLSAISVFCANFITGLLTVRPEDVVISFFCGFHNSPEMNAYPGPIGLIRSLILQIFLRLENSHEHNHRAKLNFINHRHYAEALQDHDLDILCDTFCQLLYQFHPDQQVYCIIDTLPLFDTHGMYDDLAVVLDCFNNIVNDRGMPPVVKIMLTSPAFCSMRINYLPVFEESPGRMLTLSSENLMPGILGDSGMHYHLSRPTSPVYSLAEMGHGISPQTYEDDEGYDYDEGSDHDGGDDYDEGYDYDGVYGSDEEYQK